MVPVQREGDGHTATTNITSLPHPITVLDNSSGKMEITICQLSSLNCVSIIYIAAFMSRQSEQTCENNRATKRSDN